MVGQDMKDAERAGGSGHRQLIRAGSADRDVLIDRQLGAGERDALPVERGGELNRVSVAGRGDRSAERPSAAVRRGRNRDRACVKALGGGRHRA